MNEKKDLLIEEKENDFFFSSIKHKERTINDLALFMQNVVDETIKEPLFCLFLGAGASASSGITTAQGLVGEWEESVFKKHYPNDVYTSQNAKKNFIESHNIKEGKWYDANNEYCSLFGEIYDLPAQRRNFIERQVSNKEPSIGYLYLKSLVHYNYLNTFFTTNFDDLLERSLAKDKNKRPIVCAHDSHIENMLIIHKRPKLFKLHGDFLFDKLKSSNDEVQELEENTKRKFEEFLKNYGLIVMGYAGNDNSIMEALTTLLTNKACLKNGLYWCIRKEDFDNNNISQKLKDLLMKDKVFYVLIDNFDGFCAHLAHLLLKEEQKIHLPFDIDPSQKHKDEKDYLT